MSHTWRPDILPGHEVTDIELAEVTPLPEEPPEALRAALVRYTASIAGRQTAVLYVHGWNDYYFQTELAARFCDWGYAFYAIDLRRYGRARRPGQLDGYIDTLDDYGHELAAAVAIIAESHSSVILMGHSTGGLTVSLWADRWSGGADIGVTDIDLAAVILNSPWLDMQGSAVAKAVAGVVGAVSQRMPTRIVPMPASDNYARSLRSDADGQWSYNTEWKQMSSPVRAGWLAAILAGQRRVRRGLTIACPVLVGCSARTLPDKEWSEELTSADIVLDVQRIARQAPNLGAVVTLARIPGGLHDLALSRREARDRWYAEMRRWLSAYVS